MTLEELMQWLLENQRRSQTDPEAFREELYDLAGQVNFDDQDANSVDDLNNIIALVEGFTISTDGDLGDEVLARIRGSVDGELSTRRLDTNRDGTVSLEERRAAEAQVSANAEGASQTAQDLEVLETTDPLNAPEWILQQFGREPTQAEVDAILDAYESATGERPANLFAITDPRIQQWIGSVFQDLVPGEDPGLTPTFSVMTRAGAGGPDQMVTLTVNQVEQARAVFGMEDEQIASGIQLADMLGVRRADGTGVAWQPVLALIAASGQEVTGSSVETRQQLLTRARQLRQQMLQYEATVGPGSQAYRAARRQYEEALADWRASAPGSRATEDSAFVAPSQLAARYSSGLTMYNGNEGLAFLHALDQGLAARINASGGDFNNLQANDSRLVGQYVSQAFPGAATTDDLVSALVGLGYGEAAGSDTLSGLMSLLAASSRGGGGSGRVRLTPDRVQVEQATKDLMEALYPQGADDAEVSQIADRVMAEVTGAPELEATDINARIRRAVEGLPQYQEFYGNKPATVGAGEYRGIMEAGAQSMLGAEAGLTGAAGLGMRSGEYQTAVGAAAGTSAAWDNSTFLGRLARAAQVTSANT